MTNRADEVESSKVGPEGHSGNGSEGIADFVASGDGQDGRAMSPLEQAQQEALHLRDQLLRTAAEFDNFRKRTRKELADAERKGKEGALRDLLPVFDNLERAGQSAEAATDVKPLADGVGIVLQQFRSALDGIGIQRVTAVGERFDPAVHEAIQHLESAEYPAGVIVAEVQSGYRMGEYLMRAAMVVVSKGPGSAPS